MPADLHCEHKLSKVNCTLDLPLNSAEPNTLQICTSRSGSVYCFALRTYPLCSGSAQSTALQNRMQAQAQQRLLLSTPALRAQAQPSPAPCSSAFSAQAQ